MTAHRFAFDPARGFGVYIHWPYCARICPYCDFNVYAAKSRDPEPMLSGLIADLAGWRARSGPRRVVSVFLGGGTPSLLGGAQVGRLLETINQLWGLPDGTEISLEANPEDAARFADLTAAGVNRLSLGVQALNDDALKFLGRTHSASEAIAAIEAARSGARSVSVDLIYARPGQALADWTNELRAALALGADHVSLYQLTIEEATPFGRQVRRGQWRPTDEDPSADLYEATQALCAEAGYDAYEISNHARGAEHQSKHNRIYWRCGDWVGAGPGAHGRLTAGGQRLATEAAARPVDYLRAVDETGVGWSATESLSLLDEARERVAMGLRVAEGLLEADIAALGLQLETGQLRDLESAGLLVRTEGRVALTAAGRLAADRVAALIAP